MREARFFFPKVKYIYFFVLFGLNCVFPFERKSFLQMNKHEKWDMPLLHKGLLMAFQTLNLPDKTLKKTRGPWATSLT